MPFTNEADATAQAYHAHQVYMEGSDGLPVQDALDARVAAANAAHTAVTNANLSTTPNHTVVALPHLNAFVYSGGNVVTVAANRAGVDAYPEDTQNVEDLEQEVLVYNALVAGKLFERGGFVGSYYSGVGPYYATAYSAYVDGAWLAEASKQTGEKFF